MNIFKKIFNLSPLGIQIYTRKILSSEKKFDYQKRFINFDIKKDEKVLDIGSGGSPFPYATHLADKYPGETHHRYEKFDKKDLPFTKADIEKLPFDDKSFDFVYTAHVLEHVENPAKALDELMRVGKRGYIEVPTRMSDIIFNLTRLKHFHKWHINIAGNTIIFIEYSKNDLKDTGDRELFHMGHSLFTNAFKRTYRKNKDLYTNMFLWNKKFNYYIFDKKGNIIAQRN